MTKKVAVVLKKRKDLLPVLLLKYRNECDKVIRRNQYFEAKTTVFPKWTLTRSVASSPVFKDGVRKRGSGSTLSKPWPSGRGVEGLTFRGKKFRVLSPFPLYPLKGFRAETSLTNRIRGLKLFM
jgi:hypothetical protein